MLKRLILTCLTLLIMGGFFAPSSAWADEGMDDWDHVRQGAQVANGVTQATLWEARDIWVSDQVQSDAWPVRDALEIWNANGVIRFHYTTRPCDKIPTTCVPVGAKEKPQDSNTIAYATLASSQNIFVSAKVTVMEDRGAPMNTCTLLHEFGHVIADIPHGWWIEGGEAPSVMNGECDRQLERGEAITLPLVDKWYVEEAYSRAAVILEERNRAEEEVRVREVKNLAEGQKALQERVSETTSTALLLSLLVGASISLGVCSTLLVQRVTAPRR